MNTGADAEVGGKVHKLAADCNDMERKVEDIERTIQRIMKDSDSELENLRQQLVASIQTKADFRDFDSLLQKLHSKVDTDKVQGMIGEIRQDV